MSLRLRGLNDWLLAFVLVTSSQAVISAESLGNAVRGAELYEQRCSACHSIDVNRIGPLHAGLLGRRIGRAPGFNYSPALAKSQGVWTAKSLEIWLRNPEQFLPGQRMGYRVDNAQDRADLISYLSTL